MNMKVMVVLLGLAICFGTYAQKDGKYLPDGHPTDQLWEFDGNKDYAAPIVGDMAQQFFFLIPDGSEKSMMAPFEMEGMGFACPTYFTVSVDDDYLYLDVGESCQIDLPEEEKYIKLKYRVDGKSLILTIDGMDYRYKEWRTEGATSSKEAPKRMEVDYKKGRELLSMGGWHPSSRDKLFYKGIHTVKIEGQDENGWDLLNIKGVDEKKESFEFKVRAELDAYNNYFMINIHEEDQSKLCQIIYCYFEDENNGGFLFTNTFFEPEDEILKDQNWMTTRR